MYAIYCRYCKINEHKKYITVDDLYKFSEQEILELIKNCDDNYIRNAFKNFQNATRDSVYKSDIHNNKIYCTSVKERKDILIL